MESWLWSDPFIQNIPHHIYVNNNYVPWIESWLQSHPSFLNFEISIYFTPNCYLLGYASNFKILCLQHVFKGGSFQESLLIQLREHFLDNALAHLSLTLSKSTMLTSLSIDILWGQKLPILQSSPYVSIITLNIIIICVL